MKLNNKRKELSIKKKSKIEEPNRKKIKLYNRCVVV